MELLAPIILIWGMSDIYVLSTVLYMLELAHYTHLFERIER